MNCEHLAERRLADNSSKSAGDISWCANCGSLKLNGEWILPGDDLSTGDAKSKRELEIIERWIVCVMDCDLIPADEGSNEGLTFNLLSELYGTGRVYDYTDAHDKEVEAFREKWNYTL